MLSGDCISGSALKKLSYPLSASFFLRRQGKIEIRLFILYNIQLKIINFLYKTLRKTASYLQAVETFKIIEACQFQNLYQNNH